MSLDTRDKRMSMIGFGESYSAMMQDPTGTVGAPARAMLLELYSGFSLDPPSVFNPAWTRRTNQIIGVTAPPTPEES